MQVLLFLDYDGTLTPIVTQSQKGGGISVFVGEDEASSSADS